MQYTLLTFADTILLFRIIGGDFTENLVYEPHIIKDPLIPFTLHITSFMKGEKSGFNWHANIEILYCTAGSGTIYCETANFPFEKGDVFIVNSNDLHMIQTHGSITYYCLICDNVFCKENGIDTDYIRFTEQIRSNEIAEKYENAITAFGCFEVCRAAKIRCAVLELLIALRSGYTESVIGRTGDRNPNTERIKKAMVYIRQNLSKSLTLDEIASYVGISKFYFTREFKRITGQSAFEYINIVRCKEAKRMISDGCSVSEAARNCGFENMSYFSRTYKRCIGTTPSGGFASSSRGCTKF